MDTVHVITALESELDHHDPVLLLPGVLGRMVPRRRGPRSFVRLGPQPGDPIVVGFDGSRDSDEATTMRRHANQPCDVDPVYHHTAPGTTWLDASLWNDAVAP